MAKGRIPSYLEDDVRERIAATGTESTFLVDESTEEVIVSYTGFTDALKREYKNESESPDRDEDALNIYHLTNELWALKLVRYDSINAIEGEVVWQDKVG